MRSRVLITGGTGFVGRNLLDRMLGFPQEWDVTIASRSTPAWLSELNHVVWDVASDQSPKVEVDVVIHAATPASAAMNVSSPASMFDQIVSGAKGVINFCRKQSKPPVLLFTSSGAVYGEMPGDLHRWDEASSLAVDPLDVRSAYAEGKRAAELLISIAGREGLCRPIIARLFAFSGPHLPLDRHFAIGNFVRQAAAGETIVVTGDGSAIRSYLDGRDMAAWLTSCIGRSEQVRSQPLHIGSENPITVASLAALVAQRAESVLGRSVAVRVEGAKRSTDGVSRYLPGTARTRELLGVEERIELCDSVDEMLRLAANPPSRLTS